MVSDTVGTKPFEAPEVSLRGQYRPLPTDVWALGVSIYATVFGVAPFGTATSDGLSLEKEIQTKEPCLTNAD